MSDRTQTLSVEDCDRLKEAAGELARKAFDADGARFWRRVEAALLSQPEHQGDEDSVLRELADRIWEVAKGLGAGDPARELKEINQALYKRLRQPPAPVLSNEDQQLVRDLATRIEEGMPELLPEARELRNLASQEHRGEEKDLPQAATRPEDSGSVPDPHHGPSGHRASGGGQLRPPAGEVENKTCNTHGAVDCEDCYLEALAGDPDSIEVQRDANRVLWARELPGGKPHRLSDLLAAVSGQAGEVERLRETLTEFDAWLSFRGEFGEVLTAFRKAFGTDTCWAATLGEARQAAGKVGPSDSQGDQERWKVDDDYPCRATMPDGGQFVLDDLLKEGDEVGMGSIPEDEEDRDPRPPYGRVVRESDGLWIVQNTAAQERERSQRIIADCNPAPTQQQSGRLARHVERASKQVRSHPAYPAPTQVEGEGQDG